MTLIRKIKKISGVISVFLLVAMLSGCGATATTSTSDDSDTDSYSGQAALSGYISVSSSDLAKVSGTTGAASLKSNSINSSESLAKISTYLKVKGTSSTAMNSGNAKLYAVQSDGSLVDTGFSVVVTNGEYEFKNIKDGVKYVVEVYKIGTDAAGKKNILKQKAFADIPEGTTSVKADVTEKTGVIVAFIIETIVEVAESLDIDSDLITALIEKVALKIDDKIQSGEIQIASAVGEYEEGDEEEYKETTEKEKEATEVLSDDTEISNISKEATMAAKRDKVMTIREAKEFIREVMGMTTDISTEEDSKSQNKGGGIPDFFIEQFAKSYINKKIISIIDFARAYNESILADYTNDPEYTVQAIVNKMLEAINNGKLKQLYDYYNNPVNGDDIPITAKIVFPKDQKWVLPVTQAQEMNVAQTLIIMEMAGLMGEDDDSGPPMDPILFLDKIGYATIDESSTYIIEARINPVIAWEEINGDPQGGEEVNCLQAEVEIYSKNIDVKSVLLKYKDAAGNERTAYFKKRTFEQIAPAQISALKAKKVSSQVIKHNSLLQAQDGGNQGSPEWMESWAISPWNYNQADNQYIKDFSTGEVTIEVLNNNNEVVATGKRNIYKFTLDSFISWEFPQGPDMAKIKKDHWDPGFVIPEIDVDDVTQKAQIVLKWTAPELQEDIPDGYTIVYALNLGLAARPVDWQNQLQTELPAKAPDGTEWDWKDQWGCWQNVWESWNTGRFIKTNKYLLPVNLDKTIQDLDKNYETRYEVNVTPLLMNKNTREIIWQGYSSRTEFKVGISKPWTVQLNGKVTFTQEFLKWIPKKYNSVNNNTEDVDGVWKIGLFHMNGQHNGVWTEFFFTDESEAREPVASVKELGTTQEIIDGGHKADYTFSAISKESGVLSEKNQYQIIVWYDQTEKSDWSVWSGYGEPVNDRIDYTNYHPIEIHYMMQGGFLMENGTLRYESWGKEKAWKFVSYSDEDQVFNFTVGESNL